MSLFPLGGLTSNPVSRNSFSLTQSEPTDVFSFSVDRPRLLQLYLHNISSGDVANINVYEDSNHNGVFDSSDTLRGTGFQSDTTPLTEGNPGFSVNLSVQTGTYFAQVVRGAASSGGITYDVDFSVVDPVSLPFNAATHINSAAVTESDPTDVYRFRTSSDQAIHLNLYDISAGDDVDLKLFRDVNHNIVFDADDLAAGPIATSSASGNHDDSIDILGSTGVYFAQVSRFGPGSSGNVNYDLDLSRTDPSSANKASNLLSKEFIVSGDSLFNNTLSDSDLTDTYAFTIPSQGVNQVKIDLTGLTADADIKLIHDFDSDRFVDSGEVVDFPFSGGTTSESITIGEPGSYFLQVDQFASGTINYQVNFDFV